MSFEDFIANNYEILDTGTPNEIRICCPFCGDSTFHGYINTAKSVFYCFRCEASPGGTQRGYNGYAFIKKIHGLKHREILKALNEENFRAPSVHTPSRNFSDFDPGKLDRLVWLKGERKAVDLPQGNLIRQDDPTKKGRAAWKYMRSRFGKYTKSICERFEFTYCTEGLFRDRIILPVYNKGEPVYFQARSFNPPSLQPKYLNPSAERPLFIPYAIKEEIILCEGYFDAMAIGEGAIAIFGSGLTARQRWRLYQFKSPNLTVCLDMDSKTVERSAIKLCRTLAHRYENLYIVLDLGGKDPADWGRDRAKTAIMESRKLFNIKLFL